MSISPSDQGLDSPQMMRRAEQRQAELTKKLKETVKAEVKDVGALRKDMQVTVPAEVISGHFDLNFDEIRQESVLPGFRKGRAPKHLIHKRFAAEVRDSLRTTIIGQSFYAAAENKELKVLGEPLFSISTDGGVKLMDFEQALAHLKLPESGDLVYTCEIEVKPTFELPELKGIEVKAPKIEVADKDVEEFLTKQQRNRGKFEPVQGAAELGDTLVADVKLMSDGTEVKKEDNVQLGVRPTRLDGIQLLKLDEQLKGIQTGETRTVPCEIPDDYERADLRGKTGEFQINVHEIKRLVPATVPDMIQYFGASDEQNLRQMVREELEVQRDRMIENAKKEQVLVYLLNKTTFDLPEKLSARQTDRAVMRRVIELSQSGTPEADIEARIDELRTGAKAQVARDLKLEFIMEKVAEKLEVTIGEDEVNTELARIARVYGQRFDKVRDDMHRRGLLPQLAEQVRQDKCVNMLLQDAKVEGA